MDGRRDGYRMKRRAFVTGSVSAFALAAVPVLAAPTSTGPTPSTFSKYVLWLERMGTGERVAAPFSLDGTSIYKPGYAALCAVLRDERVSTRRGWVQLPIRTIEVLWAVQQYLMREGVVQPIVVHSGYRTPETNAATEGAATWSLHMWGKAVDFHVLGVPLDDLADICSACPAAGGVGYYPEGWVHLDTGPKRDWIG